MRRPLSRALLGLLLANAAAALLLVATLFLLAAAAPANASGLAQSSSNLQIGLTVETGSGEPGVAFNGQVVTYTVRLTNNGGALSNVRVLNSLPLDTLSNVQCVGTWVCGHIFDSETIDEPLGGTLVVTVTRELTWAVTSIAANSTELLIFTGRVAGLADGTVVTNTASVQSVNGNAVSGLSTNVGMTVRVAIANRGHSEVATAATWFSSDLGGTLSQDWGDLNRDGYMDLVLGSSVGASVYFNENGRLEKLNWTNDERAYGVRWADFTGDGRLDIVVVGESEGGQASGFGTNYIYGQFTDPVTLSPTFGVSATFASDFQLVRVGVGDFDRDGDVDIVGSTNSINAPCPVRLYRNNGSGQFGTGYLCISQTATAAIGPGDYDNDGDLDLALGLFPDTIAIFVNDGNGGFGQTAIVDDSLPFLPYDFAWGDYTADGKLDLAAAFPLQKEARVFRNKKGIDFDARPFDTTPDLVFRTASFLTPLAIDWGDFNGDGRLDLMVADEAPKIYLNQGGPGSFSQGEFLASSTLLGQKWGLRGAQVDFGGDLSLAITNRDRPSLLLEGFSSHLASSLTELNTRASASLAWGDADNDGDLDLLLGAGGDGVPGSNINYNFAGTITSTNPLKLGFSGPHYVAFGDVTGNSRLNVAVATPGGVNLYPQNATQPSWTAAAASHVAFADANSDGRLDLLAATAGGGISLYLNQGTALNSSAAFMTSATGNVLALAVADFNRDFYPDFAVASASAPVRVFLNNKNNTFTRVWSGTGLSGATSVAWGDYNIDGFPDLTIGTDEQGTHIFQNVSGSISNQAVWTSPTRSKTTALAWGDWDNDGFPDLAIGNDGEPQQVYANLHSEPNLPRLYWLWSSDADKTYSTTGLAWGDVDNDGDLDLGYSQAGGGVNGYYLNGTITPSHHPSQAEQYLRTMPLPNNPPYVDVPRPGDTSNAYLYSSSEILGLGGDGTVTILYEQYDADGARRSIPTNGDPLARTIFEFSLDGGSTWKRASGVAGAAPAVTTTNREGVLGSFIWDARRDKAISDDARFRVRVVPQLAFGPTQRASTAGVSPPFRVRALSAGCVWPNGPAFEMSPNPPVPGVTTYLTGSVQIGFTNQLTYTWQFSDQSTPTLGQVTTHQFISATTYAVTLTVTGPACPATRPVVITQQWGAVVNLEPRSYLPLVTSLSGGAASGANGFEAEPTTTTEAATTQTPTDTASETATATETATETSTPAETSTGTPTEAPTEAPTQPPTETVEAPTPTAEASATTVPTETTGSSLAAWFVPQAAVNIDTSLGEPSVRTQGAVQSALAGAPSVPIYITAEDTVGISNEPSVSGDGKYIAFWSTADLVSAVGNADGNIELFVAEKASPVKYTQVTNSTGSILGGFNLSPSMDESGTRVAFFSDRDLVGQNPESSFQVFLYDSTTSAVTQVTTRTRGFNILPSLSGDGQTIAFVTDRNYGAETDGNTEAEGNSEIALARLGPGGTVSLTLVTTTTNQSNDQPRIDFDGNRIAFVSTADLTGQNADNNREVFVANLQPDGSISYTQVSHTNFGTTGQVSISSDGTYVAFISDQSPDPDGNVGPLCLCRAVFRVTLDSAGAVALYERASNNDTEIGLTQPSISADGTRIAYISTTQEELILHDVVSGVDSVTEVAANTRNPAISAGGTAVAFASEKQIRWTEFPLAELTVSKTVDPEVLFPGQLLRYTIVVTNSGPSLATGVVVTDRLSSSAVTFVPSPDQIDDHNGSGGFGPASGGSHNNTTWSTSSNPDALTLSSGLSGTYTSRIMSAGSDALWTQLTWGPERPYGKPLPDNGASETAYTAGNANMSSVAVLMHFDETSETEAYQNTASPVAAPGTCSLPGTTCPQPGDAGLFNASALFNGNPDHLDVNVLPDSGEHAAAFWFKTACADCGLLQVGGGQLGSLKRDRQVLLNAGNLCAVLGVETICATGLNNFADGQWHHVAHIYGDPAQNGGGQQLYVDGTQYASGVISASVVLSDAVINVGYATSALSPFYTGALDELVVFDRSLSEAEIVDLYRRGALQMRFQARTCTLANCADGAFVGPGGSASAYYSEASNSALDLPAVTLEGLPPGRYFQYQAWLTTSNASFAPRLQRVEVGPSHGAVETQQGFCALPQPGQIISCSLNDMAAGDVATVTVSLTPTRFGELTNTAWVISDVDEHNPENVDSVTPNVLPLPIEVFDLELAGAAGLAGQGHFFTATVGPLTASTPITYLWEATNQEAFEVSSGLTSTAVLTWFTGGPQVVTVTAINAANVLSGTPGLSATLALTVSNPVPVLTQLSQTLAPVNTGPITLVLTGSKFVGTSQVRWAGSEILNSTVVSSTRITVTVPITRLQTPGQFPIRVFNPAPGGGTSQAITFTVGFPAPDNLVLSPAQALAGGRAFSLTVTGTDIYPGAVLFWNGSARPTQVNTATQTITAAISAADIHTWGTRAITVTNPSPNNGSSAASTFTVTAVTLDLQPPALSMGLSANAVVTATIDGVQAGARTLTVVSSDPTKATVAGPVVFPAGSTQVTFTVNSGILGGLATITGTLPAHLGGDQDSVSVTVLNPSPVITGTNPVAAAAGGITLSLDISGTGFLPGVRVFWNGTELPSSLSGGVIEAEVGASLIALTNTATITAVNALPNTGPSAGFLFTTTLPTLSLTPATVSTGIDTDVTMTATTNTPRFLATVITLTTSDATVAQLPATITIPAGSSSVAFTLQAGAVGGTASVTATLPAEYGLVSDSSSVTVNNTAPVITSLSPSVVTAGGSSFTLVITGTGFVNNKSEVFHDLTQFATGVTVVNSSRIEVNVNSSLIASAGFISITVHNGPPPGPDGLTSNIEVLTVQNPAPAITAVSPATRTVGGPAFTLNVTGTNFVSGAQLYFGGQVHNTTVFGAGTRLTTTIGASEIDTFGSVVITMTNPVPTAPSVSSVPFTITELGLTLAPAPIFTRTAGISTPMTVTLDAIQAGATVITITEDPANLAVIPVTVTVPAGQPSASFPITPTSAGTVNIQALLPAGLGGNTSSTRLDILDSPLAGLTVLNGGPKDLIVPSVSITFAAQLTSGSNPSFQWDFGDGQFGSGSSPTHIYVTPVGRLYTVVVTATNASSTVLTATTIVHVNNVTPTLTAISPMTFTMGSPAQTLTLTGTRFVTGTVVNINGVARAATTNPLNPLQMTVPLAASDLDASGLFTVSVTSPTPPTPGRTSVEQRNFRVLQMTASNNGPKELGQAVTLTASITPSVAISYTWLAGDGSAPVTGGATFVHTYPSNIGGVYTAVVTATAGSNLPVTATTIVTMNNRTPTISSFSPLTRTTSSAFVITITGTNFVTGTEIRWEGYADLIPTTIVNSTRLTATIPGGGTGAIPSAGLYDFSLVAPAPPAVRRESDPEVFERF